MEVYIGNSIKLAEACVSHTCVGMGIGLNGDGGGGGSHSVRYEMSVSSRL